MVDARRVPEHGLGEQGDHARVVEGKAGKGIMTETTWKVTNKRHDGISRPAADFTLSHQGSFVAAFANEQDAIDAARAVNAAPGLAKALGNLRLASIKAWIQVNLSQPERKELDETLTTAREALKLWEQ